jgi:uncharacterized protein YegP (UPF0339 family)
MYPPHGTPWIETFVQKDGLYGWRLVAVNGEQVCFSNQGFNTRGDADRAANRAIELMGMTPGIRSA